MDLTISDVLKIVAVVGLHLLAILYDSQLVWVAFGADLAILGIQVGTVFSSRNGAASTAAFLSAIRTAIDEELVKTLGVMASQATSQEAKPHADNPAKSVEPSG